MLLFLLSSFVELDIFSDLPRVTPDLSISEGGCCLKLNRAQSSVKGHRGKGIKGKIRWIPRRQVLSFGDGDQRGQ